MSTTPQHAPQESQISNRQAFLDAEREKWLTLDEAAIILRTTPAIVSRMCRNHSVPHRREGKVIRIHLDDLKPKEVPHANTPASNPRPLTTVSAESVLDAARRRFRAAGLGR